MKSSVSGLTAAAVVLAASISLSLSGPHRAYAAPGLPASQSDGDLAVTVLSPTPKASFTGTKPVEISAFYQGTASNQIVSLELYVDGSNAFTKKLDTPETKGVISFLVDASQLSAGPHKIVVRAVAADAEVVSAKSSFIYISDSQSGAALTPSTNNGSGAPIEMSFLSPSADQKVEGTVHVELAPTADSNQSPYVSVFVDRQFKTMRNYAPYTYDLDTTTLSNGFHTIEVYAYDDTQRVGPAKVLRIYVNNPGGETAIRTDLKDGAISKNLLSDTPIAKTSGHKPVAARPIGKSVVAPHGQKSASASGKVIGPFRRPTPRMAMLARKHELSELRSILMAKRPDLLDQTSGLDLSSQLSDPFIPDTATPRPSAVTPVTGFKPMPQTQVVKPVTPGSLTSHVLATPPAAQAAHVDAQLPIAKPEPIKAQVPVAKPAQVKAQLPIAKPDPIKAQLPIAKPDPIKAQLPIAKAAPVQAQLPVAKPVHVEAQHPAVKSTPVAVHTPAKSNTVVSAPVMAISPMAQHTASIASPAAIEVHTPAMKNGLGDTLLSAPSIPAEALRPTQVRVAAPHPAAAAPKPVQVAHPVAQKPVQMVRVATPISTLSVKHITTKPIRVSTPHPLSLNAQTAVATPMRVIGSHRVQIHMGTSSMLRARGKTSVFFNTVHLKMDRPFVMHHGVMFVPLRQLAEFQGANLTWDAKTGTVHAISEAKEITLQIGKRHAGLNKSAVKLDQAPFLMNGRTMVPVSFMSQALDVNMTCDPATGHVMLTSKA